MVSRRTWYVPALLSVVVPVAVVLGAGQVVVIVIAPGGWRTEWMDGWIDG